MTLERKHLKVFGAEASENMIGQFGSSVANAKLNTSDIEQIQALNAWDKGWENTTVSKNRYPAIQERNGVDKVLTYQIAYILQEGIPEWNNKTEYSDKSIVKVLDGNLIKLYRSRVPNNIGNLVTDGSKWQEVLFIPLDKLNQSKALSTGSISNDADIYPTILKRAHSTFDKSKFEVVGSPTITDNGIASGFSIGNSINLGKYNIQNELHIKCNSNNVNLTGTNRGAIYSWYQNEQNYFRLFWYSNTQLRFDYFKQDESSVTANSFNYDANGNYIFDIIYKNNKLLLLKDGEVIHTYNGAIRLTALNLVDGQLGVQTVGSWYLEKGSIDLKSIAIWADSLPVFNGNKTGLYIAKPDNYEVVGSPTITDDGIASGFSNENYFTIPKEIINSLIGHKWKIEYEFKTKPDASGIVNRYLLGTDYKNDTTNPINLGFFNNNYYWFANLLLSDGSRTSNFYNVLNNTNFGIMKGYLEFTGSSYINATLEKTDTSWKISQLSSDLSIAEATEDLRLCYHLTSGSIDLNSFKVYVDGNLVYQPCLKIPYTEAFEHSKVVDVAYRDRVQDLYEQTGESLFYTIDEQNQNFSLPMGDIYGMITKNREILDIVYPIGRPMPEENNVLLDNEVWIEGATVNPIDYPKLFKVYGTKYGGDGTTTFKLPDMRGRTLWGSPDGSNGYIEAKLPNIKGGSVLHSQDADGALNGCFYTTRSSISGNAQFPSNGRSYATYGAGINANLSNEIYSDDATTVQPPAFKVRWKTRFE